MVKIINPSSSCRRDVSRVNGEIVYQDALHTLTEEDEAALRIPSGNQLVIVGGKLSWAERATEPLVVSRRQLREALSAVQEQQILAAIDALPDAAVQRKFRVWWEDHAEFSEDHPMVLAMVQALGWEGVVHGIFEQAAGL